MPFSKTFVHRDLKIAFYQHPDATAVLQYRIDYNCGGNTVSHYLPVTSGVEELAVIEGSEQSVLAFADILTFAENQTNSPGGVASRNVAVSIYTQHASGAWSTGDRVLTGTATNPAPGGVTLTLTGTPTGIDGRITPPVSVTDVAQYYIWISTTSPVNTALAPTLKQTGEGFSIPLEDNAVRYVVAAAIDHFGDDSFTASSTVSSARAPVDFTPIQEQVDEQLEQLETDFGSQFTTLGNRVTEAETQIDAVPGQISAATTPLSNQLTAINGQITLTNPTAGSIGERFLTAETLGQGHATKISGLESVVGTSDSLGLRARMIEVEDVITDLPSNYASSLSVSSLTSEITSARNGSPSLSSQLSTMRQTVTDGLALKASTTDLTTLSNEVTGARNGSASLGAQLATMRQTVTDGLALKASTSELSTLTSTVNTKPQTFLQATAPASTGRITGDLWADSDDNNELYRWSGSAWVAAGDLRGEAALAEITAARNGSANLNAQLTTMRQTVTDGLALKASSTEVSALTSEITSARNGSPNLNTQLLTMRQTTADGLAGKVDTSVFNTLSGEVTTARGGQSSLNTRLSNIQVAVDGKASSSDFTALLARTNSGQFTDGNQHFLDGLNGWLASAGNSNLSVTTVGGRPNVLTGSGTSGYDIYGTYRFPFDTTRKYKIKTAVWAGSGGSGVRFYVGFRAYDINGAALTHNPGSYAYVAILGEILSPGSGWHERTSAVIVPQSTGVYGYPPGTAFIELLVLANYQGGSTPWGVDYITLHDVTDGEAITANTASITTLSNTVTTNNSALASRASRLEASSENSITANASFASYPTTPGLPTNWENWDNGNGAVRVTNPDNGGYAMQLEGGATANTGIYVNTLTGSVAPGSWWVMKMRARLDAGTFRGAGMLVYGFDASSNLVNSAVISPHITPTNNWPEGTVVGDGVVGRTYEWTQVFKMTSASVSWLRLYAFNHWTGYGGTAAANDISAMNRITWLYAGIRPATPEEAAVSRANTGGGLNARISAVETVTTNGTFATASSLSSLSATVGGHTSSISSLNSVTASHTGSLASISTLSTVNGRVTGFTSTNNGSSSAFTIQADKFQVTDGTTTAAPLTVANGKVYLSNATIGTGATSGQRLELTSSGLSVWNASGVRVIFLGIE